ncbi:MAG: hypothetical protein J6I84_06080 [Bacilli bacterium]|nr:hypothetical protein [Bacilli bacterium]
MKILNKNKIIVSALALAIGASLAGSISGTVAWYQYSTRANVAFIGEAGGFSGNLQMRFASESADENAWRTKITYDQLNDELADTGYASKIVPMTYGALDKDGALPASGGYIQPLAGQADMTKWAKAEKANYAQFNLQVRYQERTNGTEANVERNVYLTKMVIQEDAKSINEGKGDLTDAIRVHIRTNDGTNDKNRLVSAKGKQIDVKGKLDLDGDHHDDQAYPENDEFGFGYTDDTYTDRHQLQDIIYGDDGNDETKEIQTSYNITNAKEEPGVHYSQEEIDAAQEGDEAYGKTTDDWKSEPVNQLVVYSENNVLYDNADKEQVTANRAIGKTVASETNYLNITVTIWVEGWQKLEGSAIWDANYIKSLFNVGIQFGVQDASAL